MLQIGWLGLLLLTYFNLFWHTIELSSEEKWGFVSFLYIMAGPISIYVAMSILMTSGSEEQNVQAIMKRRFFVVFLFLQIWIVTVDIILGNSVLSNNVLNVIIGLIVIGLIYSQKAQVQQYGTINSLTLVVLTLVIRGLDIIS